MKIQKINRISRITSKIKQPNKLKSSHKKIIKMKINKKLMTISRISNRLRMNKFNKYSHKTRQMSKMKK